MKFAIAIIAALLLGGTLVAQQRLATTMSDTEFVALCRTGAEDAIEWSRAERIRKDEKPNIIEPALARYAFGKVCRCAETKLSDQFPSEQLHVIAEMVGYHLKLQMSKFATKEEREILNSEVTQFVTQNLDLLSKNADLGQIISSTANSCQND